ncbi:MAG: DUF3137 domain-containing protein [Bacteroidia bacterium]
MRTLEEFREFFRQELSQKLDEAESLRKNTLLKAYFVWPVTILVIIGSSYGLINAFEDGYKYAIPIIILNILVFGFLGYTVYRSFIDNRKFYNVFKHSVIEGILKYIEPGITYFPLKHLPPAYLGKSGLFNKPIHRYEGDDLCHIHTENGTQIEFSEAHAYTKIKVDRVQKEESVFQGIFLYGKIHHPRAGELFIVPSTMSLEDLKSTHRLIQLELDRPALEKHFNLYAHSPTMKKHLSSALLENLEAYKNEYPERDVFIAIRDNEFFIGISYDRPLLEPKIHSSLRDIQNLEEFFLDVNWLLRLAYGCLPTELKAPARAV